MRRIFFDPNMKEDYVLRRQRLKTEADPDGEATVEVPASERVTFSLGCLTAAAYEERKDLIRGTESDVEVGFRVGSWVWFTLRQGLKGISGPGAPAWLTGSDGLVHNSVLDHIDPSARTELAGRIDALTEVQLSQVKG